MRKGNTEGPLSRRPVIHLGDAGLGRIACGAPEKKLWDGSKNWTWKSDYVTCQNCQKHYQKRTDGR